MLRIYDETRVTLWETCHHLDDIGSYSRREHVKWVDDWRKLRVKDATSKGLERQE